MCAVLFCVSVRPLKIIDFTSTGPLDLFRVHFECNHERLSVCFFVCPSGCLFRDSGRLNGLRLTHNHFQTLPGHAGHHMDQFESPPLSSRLCEGQDRHFFGRARVFVRGFLSPLPLGGGGLCDPALS